MSKIKKGKAGLPKTRKELRKEKRKEKKVKRHEYYTNRKKPGQFVLNPNKIKENNEEKQSLIKPLKKTTKKQKELESKPIDAPAQNQQVLSTEKVREKEKKEQDKLEKEMTKQRNKQLLEANLEEDRAIKRLEKQLKLNKRKSKSVPKSFAIDGLDYLLEVCDSENMKSSVLAEQQLNEVNDEFEEDLALITSDIEEETKPHKRKNKTDQNQQNKKSKLEESDEDEEFSDAEFDSENEDNAILAEEEPSEEEELSEEEDTLGSAAENDSDENSASEEETNENSDLSDGSEEPQALKKPNKNEDGTWEDIYGRLRSEDGSVIKKTAEKYIPPAIRARIETSSSDDKARIQKLERLRKQLKGHLNRLAESNMHSIATQIEELYMNNSRNDMNNTITNLILEAIVCESLSPEQLLLNNVLLIIVLHANVGTEVGAHFLQTVAKQFDEFSVENELRDMENKKLDNIVNIIAQLYNFGLFNAELVYEILERLCQKFEEKDIECILHILRSVGFSLRKDDPTKLKNLILNLNKREAGASEEVKENARVKFMLDILRAIKDNNVRKIPNYDTEHSEHLKKIKKGFIRKGNYVTPLNISLQDLLKAEERGRWWVVGSAWAGNDDNAKTDANASEENANSFSQKLLELARKQRMNTDARKNIFCVIMSAEDYLDAFEKLLKLSLKNQQDRDIIHVLLHCCLQEKKYNPYYSVLAQKFCEHDRKYQMTIKYSIWDKLKALNDHSATQVSNLAKLLSHLFMEKGLPISTLKVVEFGELDKLTLRFMRQVLLAILLNESAEEVKDVFDKVAQSDKLKMFRESLRLFIHHFLLRNLETQSISQEKKDLLQERAKMVEKILTRKSVKF